MRTFGERLKVKIMQAGINQNDLADILNVDRSTVSQWARNKCTPTEENLNAICAALDCDTDWLLGNTRQVNRNGSGAIDPTAYEAIKNIENEGKTMEFIELNKGTVWNVETEGGAKVRQAVIVSADFRARDRYVNAIFLNPEERGRIIVPVELETTMYVDCAKISLLTSDRIISYVGELSESEMSDVDMGMLEALSLMKNEDIDRLEKVAGEAKSEAERSEKIKEEKPAAMLDETQIKYMRLEAERDMYKEQFEKLLEKMIG